MAAGLLKFKAPPTFSGKTGEDPADWIDRYEVLADYNRWSYDDKRLNFGIYMEGPARQWFQCLTPPTQWADTAAVGCEESRVLRPEHRFQSRCSRRQPLERILWPQNGPCRFLLDAGAQA